MTNSANRIVDRFKLLNDLSRDINSSLEIDVVLNQTMDKMIELMEAERGFIMLADAELESAADQEPWRLLSFRIARNCLRQTVSEVEFLISRAVVNEAIRRREPVITTSASDDTRFSASRSIVLNNLRSILCVPMIVRGKLVGVVYVDNRTRTSVFNTEDAQLLETFAQFAGIAIDNARLFAQLLGLKKCVDAIFDTGLQQSTENSFDILAPLGQEVAMVAGAVVWREGDPSDLVILVASGELEVYHETSAVEIVALRTVGPGSVIGELGCLQRQPRSATVRVTADSKLIRISDERFRAVMRKRPDLLEKLFWQQADRVRSLSDDVYEKSHTAVVDRLTRLYNFGFFRDRLRDEVRRAPHTGDAVSIVLFDVDHFKHYNDQNGHQEGNECLIKVASVLKEVSRKSDIVARYGGEEFVVLLYGATREQAAIVGEKVRKEVYQSDFKGGEGQPLGRVSVSGGVATFPDDANSDDQLIEAADTNLYRAKREGRNRIVAEAAK